MPRIEPSSRPTSPSRPLNAAAAKGAAGPEAATGSLGRDAASLSCTRDASSFSGYLQDQGDTNACGTTSLAMLLSFWKGKPEAYTHQKIDKSARGFDGPTSWMNAVNYANANGFRAVSKNGGTLEELTRWLDQGTPAQVLIDVGDIGTDMTLHYVIATGYEKDAKGAVTGIKLADPSGGYEHTMPIEEFKKRWGKIHIQGVNSGLDNVMNLILPKENVSVRGTDGKLRNTNDIALPAPGKFGTRARIGDFALDALLVADQASRTIKGFTNQVSAAAKKVWSKLFG